jgi:hypothetical protein
LGISHGRLSRGCGHSLSYQQTGPAGGVPSMSFSIVDRADGASAGGIKCAGCRRPAFPDDEPDQRHRFGRSGIVGSSQALSGAARLRVGEAMRRGCGAGCTKKTPRARREDDVAFYPRIKMNGRCAPEKLAHLPFSANVWPIGQRTRGPLGKSVYFYSIYYRNKSFINFWSGLIAYLLKSATPSC